MPDETLEDEKKKLADKEWKEKWGDVVGFRGTWLTTEPRADGIRFSEEAILEMVNSNDLNSKITGRRMLVVMTEIGIYPDEKVSLGDVIGFVTDVWTEKKGENLEVTASVVFVRTPATEKFGKATRYDVRNAKFQTSWQQEQSKDGDIILPGFNMQPMRIGVTHVSHELTTDNGALEPLTGGWESKT